MEFAIIGYDATDEDAPERRMAVRDSHMETIARYRQAGNMIHGGALLDDSGKMIGSIIICTFPNREALDGWLKNDPYVTGNVWKDIQIIPFKTAPSFVDNIPQPANA